jgi:catechol 2,3-dioxygenase-like lactoylglutathione lyase family enzyme
MRRGVLSRRELLGVFAATLLPKGFVFAVQAEELQFAGLDRVEFYASNVEKSRDFFVNVFGSTLKNRNGKRYVKLGSSYIAFEPPRGNAGQVRVDHFSISIKHLEMPKLHEFLDRRGVMYQDYPSGRDTGITDSDGIRTQLSPENGWSFLSTSNFPAEAVATESEPVFRPITLSQVLLNVSDPEKANAFYRRFLGPPTDRGWFQVGSARVMMQRTPEGERPGIRAFGVFCEAFSADAAVMRLQEIGAAEVQVSNGTLAFRDLDGFRILVTSL